MAKYEEEQIKQIENKNDEFFRLKIQSADNETNWMNISPSQLKKIKAIVRK